MHPHDDHGNRRVASIGGAVLGTVVGLTLAGWPGMWSALPQSNTTIALGTVGGTFAGALLGLLFADTRGAVRGSILGGSVALVGIILSARLYEVGKAREDFGSALILIIGGPACVTSGAIFGAIIGWARGQRKD
jgi:hypothetical protein